MQGEGRHLTKAPGHDGNRIESVGPELAGETGTGLQKTSAQTRNLSRAHKHDRSNVDKIGASTEVGGQAIPIVRILSMAETL